MKKIILAALAASAFLLAGCGPAGPAPVTGTNEWVEVDDIGVRVGVGGNSFLPIVDIEINNHRDKQIDRETIELVSIEGEHTDEDDARATFNEDFVNDIPAGEIATGSIVADAGDGAKMTIAVDGIEFPFDLSN